ncbi:hypothetical protein [Ekhidna sp.]|uniref:hypothetical protein n=1 Tax=Ekhidna sp. TaxID=2608089 RepID=UPI003C7DA5A2
MKNILAILVIITIASCNEQSMGPKEEILNPQNEILAGMTMVISFEELINTTGSFRVIDLGNNHLFFLDGQAACPEEQEEENYALVDVSDLSNLRGVFINNDGVEFYVNEGEIYTVYLSEVDLTHDRFCVTYPDVQEFTCGIGKQFCVVTTMDCYQNGVLISSSIIEVGPCTPCDSSGGGGNDDQKPWNILCYIGLKV